MIGASAIGAATFLVSALVGTSPITAISAGATHSCAVASDGSVHCWGDGAATRADGVGRHRVPNAKHVQAVAVGRDFTCLLHRSGRVRCFGDGDRGQLGDGTRHRRADPGRAVLEDGVAIAAGDAHACALVRSGHVLCWGDNRYGQVGGGTRHSFVPAPTTVRDLKDAVAVALGDTSSCALTKAGEAFCWGDNVAGQLGDGTMRARRAAVRVMGVDDATALYVGGRHACARSRSGALSCWGSGTHGELLDGGAEDRALAATATVAAGELALGAGFSCVHTAGELRCIGGPVERPLPLDDGALLAAGSQHVCSAVGERVSCVGYGGDGQLGQAGATGSRHPMPARVARVQAQRLSATEHHTCASTARGRVCWGEGNGHASAWAPKMDVPAGIPGTLTDLARGDMHACALNDAGRVWCWGEGSLGQLGNGDVAETKRPTRVRGIPQVIQLGVGAFHTCVRDDRGEVWCWGNQVRGELGPQARRPSARPVRVVGVERAVQLGVGRHHACARTQTGEVLCWGRGDRGELGDGSGRGSRWPVGVLGVRPARSLAVGGEHACAVTDDGGVACWGRGHDGQLGDGRHSDSLAPVSVVEIGAVVEVVAGEAHTCARAKSNEVHCWGRDDRGQLGRGGTTTAEGWVEVAQPKSGRRGSDG
jgi:alpha-tubulin suppressor-like RCC1 family protein